MDIEDVTVDALIDRYAVLLLDAYGVLVTSDGALPGAGAFIERLNRLAKPYFVVTNDASRLPASAAARYRRLGLAIDEARLVTSGQILVRHFADHGLAGARTVVLGPEDSVAYVELAGGRPVAPAQVFDAVVIGDESGFPFLETVDAVLSGLVAAFDEERPVALVCPNPDLVYPRSRGFGVASGSVALVLEAALALRYPQRPPRFTRLGKPHAPIFEEALRRCGSRDVVMIGDQLETDIRGARALGLDAALVLGGVTGAATIPPEDARPTYVLRSL